MKRLEEYMFEKITDLITYLKNNDDFKMFSPEKQYAIEYIMNSDDATPEVHNVIQKIHLRSKETISKFVDLKMKNDKNYTHKRTFKNALMSISEKYHCYAQITFLCQAQLDNINQQITENENTKESSPFYRVTNFEDGISLNSIKTYYNEFLKKNNLPPLEEIKNKNFFDSLLEFESAGQPTIGKGEFLLRFISLFPLNETKESDIVIIDNNGNYVGVEIKNISNPNTSSREAKLSNGEKGSPNPLFDFLERISGKKIEKFDISNGTAGYEDVKNILINLKENNIENLYDVLKECISAGFYRAGEQLKNNYDDIIMSAINKFVESDNNPKTVFGNFLNIFGSLWGAIYCGEENAAYICIINPDKQINFVRSDFNSILKNKIFKIRRVQSKKADSGFRITTY